MDNYQSMNFELQDENIMLVTDCEEPGADEGPEEGSRWTMVFDGASNALGKLCFNCTNNMAEYEACIMGLKADIDLRIKFLIIFGDSALVISPINGKWDTKHPNLILYMEYMLTLLPHLEEVTFEHFPREEN